MSEEKRLGEYVLRWVCWVWSGLKISLDKKDKTKNKPCLFHTLVDSCRSDINLIAPKTSMSTALLVVD